MRIRKGVHVVIAGYEKERQVDNGWAFGYVVGRVWDPLKGWGWSVLWDLGAENVEGWDDCQLTVVD